MTCSKRLWPHVVALGAILCVLVLAFGRNSLVRDGLVSADEGAVLSQMEVRRTTGDWGMPNPLPAVDPDARWFGISGSDLDADRAYPYAKHVAYPAVAQPFFDLGGARLVVGLSAVGSLVTAALAALLARRVRRDLDVPTLWVVGIVSPIFFDSFWAIAHSMGAAFATGAVLAAVVAIERRQARWILLAALAVAAAALLRSEGMLFGVALGGGLLALAGMRRDRLAAAAGVAAGAAASVAWWIDGRLHTAVVGATHPPFRISTTADQTWLSARWDGAWASLLRPQLQATTTAGTIFLGVALAGALAALYVRAKPTEVRLIRGLAGIAGVAAIAALAFRVAPVPGLLVAFPILPIGLIVATRSTFESVTARIVGVTALLFSGAVVATQYAVGGSMEWGGRFFHLAIPALVPVVLMSLDGARSRLDPTTRRITGAAIVAVSAVLVVFAVGSVARLQSQSGDLARAVHDLADGRVVVTNFESLGRFTWKDAVHGRFLSVPESDDLGTVAARLADEDIDEFVFAAPYRQETDRARLEGYEPVDGLTRTVGEWELSVMRRSTE